MDIYNIIFVFFFILGRRNGRVPDGCPNGDEDCGNLCASNCGIPDGFCTSGVKDGSFSPPGDCYCYSGVGI